MSKVSLPDQVTKPGENHQYVDFVLQLLPLNLLILLYIQTHVNRKIQHSFISSARNDRLGLCGSHDFHHQLISPGERGHIRCVVSRQRHRTNRAKTFLFHPFLQFRHSFVQFPGTDGA